MSRRHVRFGQNPPFISFSEKHAFYVGYQLLQCRDAADLINSFTVSLQRIFHFLVPRFAAFHFVNYQYAHGERGRCGSN